MPKENEKAVIVFQATEDIINENMTKTAMLAHEEEQIQITKGRTYLSYCYEFCGRVDVPYQKLKFKINEKDIKFDSQVRQSCIVKVSQQGETSVIGGSQLKESLKRLKNNEKHADIQIKVEGEVLMGHKCLLAARSQTFKNMFESNLQESDQGVIEIKHGNAKDIKKILDWIYTGEVAFPESYQEIFHLLELADDYLLEDLRRKGEDELLFRLGDKNVLQILVESYKVNHIVSDNLIETCISTLLDELELVKSNNKEDFEQLITSQPGLLTKILTFVHQRKNKFKRVAFLSRDSSRDETFFSNP